jgi:hypothetical protein
VSNVSAWTKLGIATRVVKNQVTRSRTYRAASGAVRASVRSFGRVLHQLWLEVTGAIFLTMTAVGVTAVVREYVKYSAGHATVSRVVVAAGFTLTFAWFTMTSFWRARRKSRS